MTELLKADNYVPCDNDNNNNKKITILLIMTFIPTTLMI